MNRLRVLRVVLPLFLAGALWLINERRPQPASHILARCPNGDAFDYVVQSHLNFTFPNDPQQTYFSATWFVNRQPELQMNASALWEGSASFGRLDFVFSKRSIYPITISIPAFPPSEQGDLLLVTFNNITKYETRVYDRTRTPQVVLDILKLTGAPLEELKSE